MTDESIPTLDIGAPWDETGAPEPTKIKASPAPAADATATSRAHDAYRQSYGTDGGSRTRTLAPRSLKALPLNSVDRWRSQMLQAQAARRSNLSVHWSAAVVVAFVLAVGAAFGVSALKGGSRAESSGRRNVQVAAEARLERGPRVDPARNVKRLRGAEVAAPGRVRRGPAQLRLIHPETRVSSAARRR